MRQPPPQSQQIYSSLHSESDLWARLSQPGVTVSVLAIIIAVAYQIAQNQAAARNRQLPTFVELLWNTAVYLVPARLLYAIDRWVNPPLFPLPMLQPLPTDHTAKSEVLHRILRTDQAGGIVASMSQAGRRAYTSTFSSAKGDSRQPAGLGNWDNSCFQNSILQGLSSLKHLPPYLAALTPALNEDASSTTVGALRAFVAELTNPSNYGKTLYTPGILKNMSTIQQQDAQEYFSKLLDRVDKDIEKAAKAACKPPGLEGDLVRDDSVASQHSDDSGYQSLTMLSKAGSDLVAIRSPLEGLSAQRVACTTCGFSEGLSMNPFNCLTLDFDAGVGNCTLDELFDRYVQLEFIQGVNCTKCTLLAYRQGLEKMAKAIPVAAQRLQVVEDMLEEDGFDEETLKKLKIPDAKKVSSTKTKQVAIARPPPSLAIHMQRSVFNPYTEMSYKNTAAVEFPAVLDIGPWCIGSAQGVEMPTPVLANGEGSEQGEEPKERWILDATASMVAGGTHVSQISGPLYELRAVITHYGRHENGHYVCYRKHVQTTRETVEGVEAEETAELSPASAVDSASDELDDTEDGSQKQQSSDAASPAIDTDEPYAQDMESQWWRLSDETVIPVSEEDVLAQGGVFMLFYDCVDPNSVLVTPAMAADGIEAKNQTQADSILNERGRNSPSHSEESDATLCNAPMDQENSQASSVSEVSLVSDAANDVHMREAQEGASHVSMTELVDEEDQPALVDRRSAMEQHKPHVNLPVSFKDQEHDTDETSGSKIVKNQDGSMTEDVAMQGGQEYEPMEQAEDSISEASPVNSSRRSSVTLAGEENGGQSPFHDDGKMEIDEAATPVAHITV